MSNSAFLSPVWAAMFYLTTSVTVVRVRWLWSSFLAGDYDGAAAAGWGAGWGRDRSLLCGGFWGDCGQEVRGRCRGARGLGPCCGFRAVSRRRCGTSGGLLSLAGHDRALRGRLRGSVCPVCAIAHL